MIKPLFMHKLLIPLLTIIALPTTVNAETIYLVLKSGGYNTAVALISIPMESMNQCEEAGLRLISSERFDIKHVSGDGFECIKGR